MLKPVAIYDLAQFKRLWAAGKTHLEIAAALGCSECQVGKIAKRHGLPKRGRGRSRGPVVDPTADEIAERSSAIKAKNIEILRRSDPKPIASIGSIREVAWDGYRFNAVS